MSFFARVVADAKTPVTASGAGKENLAGVNGFLGELTAGEATVPTLLQNREAPHIPVADDLSAIPAIAADTGRQVTTNFSPASESPVAIRETMPGAVESNVSGNGPLIADAEPVLNGDTTHRENTSAGGAEPPAQFTTPAAEITGSGLDDGGQTPSGTDISFARDGGTEREEDAQPEADIAGGRALSRQLLPGADEGIDVSAKVGPSLSKGLFASDGARVYSDSSHSSVIESTTSEAENSLDEASYGVPDRSDEASNTFRSTDRGESSKMEVRIGEGHGNGHQVEGSSPSQSEVQRINSKSRSKEMSSGSGKRRSVAKVSHPGTELSAHDVRHESDGLHSTTHTRQAHDEMSAATINSDSRNTPNSNKSVRQSQVKSGHADKMISAGVSGSEMARGHAGANGRRSHEVRAVADTPRSKSVPATAMPGRIAQAGAKSATASRSGNEVHIGQVDVVIEAARPTAKPAAQPVTASFDSCHYIRGL